MNKPAVTLDHFGGRFARQFDARAHPGRVTHSQLHPSVLRRNNALQQQLHAATTHLAPTQSRTNNPGIVEYQHVAG